MYNKLKGNALMGGLFILMLLAFIISGYFNSRKDYKKEIQFVVDLKVINSIKRCYLFDKNATVFPITSHTFFESSPVYIGDSITKKSNSEMMYIYRKFNKKEKIYYLVDSISIY